MLITRLCKIVMCLVLGLFCALVAFDNVTAFQTNYLFVQHVLSMDTTFPGNDLTYRSITDPLLWRIAYALIITAEALTGLLFLAGALRMWQEREASSADFNRAKAYAIAGALAAFLVWFFGFMVVAGEWFAMWQSQSWNGIESAFRFSMIVLAVLIFLNQPDPDPAGAPAAPEPAPKRRGTDKEGRVP
jgi:predicted small integral membrane protein